LLFLLLFPLHSPLYCDFSYPSLSLPSLLSLPLSDHGNDLFKWGKKNPAQYSNCIPSYNEAETYALSIPLMGSQKTVQETKKKGGQESENGKGGKEEEGEERAVVEEEEEEDESKCLSKEDKALLVSQIYANRAMAHMMLKYVHGRENLRPFLPPSLPPSQLLLVTQAPSFSFVSSSFPIYSFSLGITVPVSRTATALSSTSHPTSRLITARLVLTTPLATTPKPSTPALPGSFIVRPPLHRGL